MLSINIVFYIVIAIIVFSFLIVSHEFGHFICAKLSHVKVNEFSLGMGPLLFKIKKGETQYSIRVFPIGGFCSMEGEDRESSQEGAFYKAPILNRILIVSAGAIMNILIGFVLVVIIMTFFTSGIGTTTVASFRDGSVSNKTGLRAGDRITKINGSGVNIDTDIIFDLMQIRSGKANVQVIRSGKAVNLESVQFPLVSDGNGGKVSDIDFWVTAMHKNVFTVLSHSFYWTIATVKLVWMTLYDMSKGIYTVKDLSGPVGVSVAMGKAASAGISPLLTITALITINLGVVNMLPLPALDGGRLVFLIVEAIRRKPIEPQVEGYIHFAGFVALMLLVVFVTYNDIARLNLGGIFGAIFR